MKADAVDLVGQAVRVFAHQSDGVVAVRLAHAPRVGFAQTNVAQPGVHVGDAGYRGKRGVDGARPLGGDAFDDAQLLGVFADDLEHALAEALDGFAPRTGPRWVVYATRKATTPRRSR